MATGCTSTNWDAGRDPQLPSERPPIRAAYRPVRTIAAVVPASWRSTTLTPPQPLHGAAPSSKPPFCSSSWARASRGANGLGHRETQRSRPRRPNTVLPGVAGRHRPPSSESGRRTLGPKGLGIIVGSFRAAPTGAGFNGRYAATRAEVRGPAWRLRGVSVDLAVQVEPGREPNVKRLASTRTW